MNKQLVSFTSMSIGVMIFWFCIQYQFPQINFNLLLWLAGYLAGIGLGYFIATHMKGNKSNITNK